MQAKTKKIIIFSVISGVVLFLGTGILIFMLMSGDGNSAMSLKMILNSNRYSEEEKLEYAYQYIHNFATGIDSELHLMECKTDYDDENWNSGENGTKWDVSGIEMPRYIRIEDYCAGDIGNDGIEDIAIIYGLHVNLSRDEEYDAEGTRVVCVYRQKEDGTYEFWQENRAMICEAHCFGKFTNWNFGVNVIDGELHCFTDEYGYYFDICDENLVMIRSEQKIIAGIHYDILDGRYPSEYWNYEEGIKEVYAEEHWSGTSESENLKIGEENFEPVLIAFEDAEKFYPSLKFQGYLPVFYTWEVNGNTPQNNASEWSMRPENTGAKILDYIKETYYPDMVRVEMGYSDEVIANNVDLLGFVFPTYYYQDTQGNRLYFCDTYPYSHWNNVQQDCLIHAVMYEYSYGNTIRYKVEDQSMEVIEEPFGRVL